MGNWQIWLKGLVAAGIARLETQMKNLVGNGQPGRIAELERRVRKSEKYMWMIAGAGIAAGWVARYLLASVGLKLP